MIICSTQQLTKYNFSENGVEVGLYKTYQDRIALLSLISFMTPVMYQWESGSPVPSADRIVRLTPELERLLVDTLDVDLEGERLATLLDRADDPIEFWQDMLALRPWPIDMPILQHYDDQQLSMILGARVLSWAKSTGRAGWGPVSNINPQFIKVVKENAYGRYAD